MILSLVNVKGGVGKTTTAVNLAAAFAGSGLRVLVVDLDPQGSATFSLGVEAADASPSSTQVLIDGLDAGQAIRETSTAGVELVPGALGPVGADLALARKQDPAGLLKKALAPVRRRYDFIVVDCPPGLSVLTLNGLAACDAYVVPVVPHDLDLEALYRFFEGVEAARPTLGGEPRLLGILLTMVDRRTKVTDQVLARVRKNFGRRVFRAEIPINVRLAEAPAYGETIFRFERWSTGGQAYSRLGAEVIRRARQAKVI